MVWEKRYDLSRDETLKSICYDPFDSSKLYILSSVCIIKQLDFGLSLPKKPPRRVFLADSKRQFLVGRDLQDTKQPTVLQKVLYNTSTKEFWPNFVVKILKYGPILLFFDSVCSKDPQNYVSEISLL